MAISITRTHDHSFFAVGFVGDEPRSAVCLDCGYRVPAVELIDSPLVPDARLCGILLAQRRAVIAARAARIDRLQMLVAGGMRIGEAVYTVQLEKSFEDQFLALTPSVDPLMDVVW